MTSRNRRIIWRYVVGAFQVRIPVTTKDTMLRPEEDTLAIVKWRLENMAPLSRWRPVLERYLTCVAAGSMAWVAIRRRSLPR